CDRHINPMDFEPLRDALVKAQVLQHRNGQLRFRYKAGFYYFVAMYLSDNLAKEPVRNVVTRLCGQLYREDAANIVLFLRHLSRDGLIIQQVLASADSLYKAFAEADLIKDSAFTTKLVPKLEGPVLEDS